MNIYLLLSPFRCFFRKKITIENSVLAHISPQIQVPSDKGQMQHVPTGYEHMAPYAVIVRDVLIYMCVVLRVVHWQVWVSSRPV